MHVCVHLCMCEEVGGGMSQELQSIKKKKEALFLCLFVCLRACFVLSHLIRSSAGEGQGVLTSLGGSGLC